MLFDARAEFDRWFAETLGEPTAIQKRAWPAIRRGSHVLLSAATGQGKTLAAWRPILERIAAADSTRGVRALHIAPLKALARDITHNLKPALNLVGGLRGSAPCIGLRGAHLALSLARLDALLGRKVQRIGVSATIGAPEPLTAFLTGADPVQSCAVVIDDRSRAPRIELELPPRGLGAWAGAALSRRRSRPA